MSVPNMPTNSSSQGGSETENTGLLTYKYPNGDDSIHPSSEVFIQSLVGSTNS